MSTQTTRALLIFAYKRKHILKRMLKTLIKNDLSGMHIYAFVDYSEYQDDIIDIIKSYLNLDSVFVRHERYGLNKNITVGIWQIFQLGYESIIVVEDDMLIKHTAIEYIKDGLDRYEHYPQVAAISAYSPHISLSKRSIMHNTFLCWVWGTWKNRRLHEIEHPDTSWDLNIRDYFKQKGYFTMHPRKTKVRHIGWSGEHYSWLNIVSIRRILRTLNLIKQ